jgi:hypothetical protein
MLQSLRAHIVQEFARGKEIDQIFDDLEGVSASRGRHGSNEARAVQSESMIIRAAVLHARRPGLPPSAQ